MLEELSVTRTPPRTPCFFFTMMEHYRTQVDFLDKWHVKEQQKTHPGGRLQMVTPEGERRVKPATGSSSLSKIGGESDHIGIRELSNELRNVHRVSSLKNNCGMEYETPSSYIHPSFHK